MPKIKQPSNKALPEMHLKASLLLSPADGADLQKVQVIARSGDPMNMPYWGSIVHDLSGMEVKDKIPLDYNHDPDDSIGYLDSFDTSSGDLVCSGAIVLVDGEDGDDDDDVSGLVAKMRAGVPYEASIEFAADMTLEFIPGGASTEVNGRTVEGPVTVAREWELKAVAICKFGCDSQTSTRLAASKSSSSSEGYFVQFSKSQPGKLNNTMSDNTPHNVPGAVDTEVKIAPKDEGESKVEVNEDPKQVEVKPEEVPAPKASASDDRADFKRFVSAFGPEKAAVYFSEGKSFEESMGEHVKFQASRIGDLEKRLTAIDRGADSPLKVSSPASIDMEVGKKQGLASVHHVPTRSK